MGLFSSRLTAREMAPMCRQLATSYDAGIPILQGLALAARHSASSKVRGLLGRIHARIRKGATLMDAARVEQKLLPDFFVEVLGAGETGGHLDVMLRDLADYYEDQAAMKRTVVVAMVYPGMQLAAAWFLGTFALRIIPFVGGGRGDFSLEAYFRSYLLFQAGALSIAALAFAAMVVLARLGLYEHVTGFVKTFVWPIRTISRRFALARFFRGMSLLVGAGIDIRQCIQRSARLTMNPYMERDLLQAVPVVARGGTLVEAFSKVKCVSSVGREMLAVGEQSGNLEFSLKKVSDYHFEEARAAVRSAMTIGGVLVLLLVGGLIGYIVISFYAGLYSNLGIM